MERAQIPDMDLTFLPVRLLPAPPSPDSRDALAATMAFPTAPHLIQELTPQQRKYSTKLTSLPVAYHSEVAGPVKSGVSGLLKTHHGTSREITP